MDVLASEVELVAFVVAAYCVTVLVDGSAIDVDEAVDSKAGSHILRDQHLLNLTAQTIGYKRGLFGCDVGGEAHCYFKIGGNVARDLGKPLERLAVEQICLLELLIQQMYEGIVERKAELLFVPHPIRTMGEHGERLH